MKQQNGISLTEMIFVATCFCVVGLASSLVQRLIYPGNWFFDGMLAASLGLSGAAGWLIFCRKKLSARNSIWVGVVAGLFCMPIYWVLTYAWPILMMTVSGLPPKSFELVTVFGLLLAAVFMILAAWTIPVGIITALTCQRIVAHMRARKEPTNEV